MYLVENPPLGLGHFSVIGVPPLALVSLAAKIGYAAIGLRLHPAFPGAPTYDVPAGSEASREMRRRMEGEGVGVYDFEFVAIDADFSASALKPMLEAAGALGARRLSVCGDDPDGSRLVANFAALCDLAAEFSMGIVAPWSWELTTAENPAYPRTDEIHCQIGGTHGSLAIPQLDLWRNKDKRSWTQPIAPERLSYERQDPLRLQVRQFCKVIRHEEAPLVSGREGLETLRVIDAVKRSAATGEIIRLRHDEGRAHNKHDRFESQRG